MFNETQESTYVNHIQEFCYVIFKKTCNKSVLIYLSTFTVVFYHKCRKCNFYAMVQ